MKRVYNIITAPPTIRLGEGETPSSTTAPATLPPTTLATLGGPLASTAPCTSTSLDLLAPSIPNICCHTHLRRYLETAESIKRALERREQMVRVEGFPGLIAGSDLMNVYLPMGSNVDLPEGSNPELLAASNVDLDAPLPPLPFGSYMAEPGTPLDLDNM